MNKLRDNKHIRRFNESSENLNISDASVSKNDWSMKFKEMHENGDDKLLIDDVFEDENMEDWQ